MNAPNTDATLEPRFEQGRPMLLAGLRRFHRYADMPRDIPVQWAEFMSSAALPYPGQVAGVTYGAVCQNVVDTGSIEYMCAVEVTSFDGLPDGTGRMRVPAAEYAVFTHDGPIAGIGATWDAIWNRWLPRSGRTAGDTPDFERYDARYDATTGNGIVEIWFPVVPR